MEDVACREDAGVGALTVGEGYRYIRVAKPIKRLVTHIVCSMLRL
jgi:hypothetical protein